jgi:hypothetical protein
MINSYVTEEDVVDYYCKMVFNLAVKEIAEIMVEEIRDLSPLNELGVYQ